MLVDSTIALSQAALLAPRPYDLEELTYRRTVKLKAALGVGHVFVEERKRHACRDRLHKLPCAGYVIADMADVQLKVQTDSGTRCKARARKSARL